MNRPFFISPGRLEHVHVVLEPMEREHVNGLYELGLEPAIWTLLPRGEFNSREDAEGFVESALSMRDKGEEFPFVVIHKETGKLAGSTRYLEISESNRSLEIGWTWYGPAFQRTAVNTECKLLLMQYAFEELHALRMQFKTDARNMRSQEAIKRIGGKYEGTLRKHRVLPKDGFIRDSVYFSVVDDEWPGVKANLLRQLERF